MTDRELMQQALEALIEARMAIIHWSGYASEYFRNKYNADGDAAANDELITALRERLAQPEHESATKAGELRAMRDEFWKQPEQEPVALETVYETIIQWDEGGGKRSRRELARRIVDLYSPPQRKPLTDEEIEAIHQSTWIQSTATLNDFARAIEAAHGIKGDA